MSYTPQPGYTYHLQDDDGLLYMIQYLLTKLKPYLVDTNTTYALSYDSSNKRIVLTDSDNQTTYVGISDLPVATTSAKGLMSDTDKTKLDGVASGAQVNVLETVKVDNTALTPDANKAVNIPAASANGRGVVSNADINTLIQAALAGFERISFQKVNSYSDLPATGSNGVIYLVPNSGTSPNIYDEYIWYTDSSTTPATSGYEKIGTTTIDLSGYVQFTDIHILSNSEIADIVDDAYDAVWPPSNS